MSEETYGRYKEHFACFKCRKMFRKAAWRGLGELPGSTFEDYQDFVRNYYAPCPQCDQLMPNMGKGFRPPQQKSVKQWRDLEAQAKQGVRFYGWHD